MQSSAWMALVAVTAVVSLGLGAVAGWFGHRAYIISELEVALGAEFDDFEDFDDTDPAEVGDAPDPEPAPQGPPEANSDSDGVFTYTVVDSDTADSYTDEWGETLHAEDTYVIVSVAAENTADAPGTPAADPVYETVTAYDHQGRSYSADWDMWPDVTEVNPGGSARYDVVFDVAQGVELAVLELGASVAPDRAVVEIP